mgnify:FL=1
MYRTLIFNDPFGGTSMNARETLLFCAYNHFTIPHDFVGAILFGDALAGHVEQIKALWDIDMFVPSLCTFIADADWYLAAIKSMGYPDIVEEFESVNREYHEYAKNHHHADPDNLEALTQKLESLIPARYMDIIQKCQVDIKTDLSSAAEGMKLPLEIGYSSDDTIRIIDLTKAKNILVAGAPGQGIDLLLDYMCNSFERGYSQNNIQVHYFNSENDLYSETEVELELLEIQAILQNRYESVKSRTTGNIVKKSKLVSEKNMQYIVLIFNEYTILNGTPDLMKILLQLAQKGPRVGIHLIISTAYPSVNVISNKIKMLFPTRIAFKTRSKVDSRTILDMPGAEELKAFYDMLLLHEAELCRLEAMFSRNIVF